MSEKTIQVPPAFMHPLFFKTGQITYDTSLQTGELAEIPFLMDILYNKSLSPRRIPSSDINKLFESWKTESIKIAAAFNQRNRPVARPLMIASIGWFITLVFWVNGKRVEGLTHLKRDLATMAVLPVNIEERLSFVMEVPDHYQTYIQLEALFEELEKKWHIAERKKQHMDNN